MLKTDYFVFFAAILDFLVSALLYGIADVFAGMAMHVNITLLFGIAKNHDYKCRCNYFRFPSRHIGFCWVSDVVGRCW